MSSITAQKVAIDSVAGRIQAARRDWCEVVGAEHVISDPGALRAAQTTTFATHQTVPSIVRPANRRQVQQCVQIANRHRVPLYAISSGFNWGYGSRVPAADACVLLDLRRMNRIVDFNEQLAYATVEPGVTQAQLLEFLRARKSNLWLDATGSTPSASLIGNTMERGFGHTPYGDHFANVCGLEVVLPNGDCIDTGFARLRDAAAASLYRWGVGPSLDGLFSQSNLGIVTRMTLWLMPAPERFEAFFFRCDSDDALEAVIEALRPLRLDNTLRSAVHIGNDYKVLSAIRQYPWEELGGQVPLRPDAMHRFRSAYRCGVWNGSGGLYGTPGQVKEAKRILRRKLRGVVAGLVFLDDNKLRLASRFSRPFQLLTGWDLSRAMELAAPVFGLLKGIPTDKPLASTYWRKRTPIPEQMDPDRDGCGLLWCAPVAPLQGAHVRAVARIATEILLRHGFEPILSLTLITERAVACVITIAYDRDVPGEDGRAMRCYRELLDSLNTSGYHSYRLGIQAMNSLPSESSYGHLLRTLKTTLDPNGILSPGRYVAS
jgi:4-cresol dehydrogenase (hydroxylating)